MNYRQRQMYFTIKAASQDCSVNSIEKTLFWKESTYARMSGWGMGGSRGKRENFQQAPHPAWEPNTDSIS